MRKFYVWSKRIQRTRVGERRERERGERARETEMVEVQRNNQIGREGEVSRGLFKDILKIMFGIERLNYCSSSYKQM